MAVNYTIKYEDALFDYVTRIKKFNGLISDKYQLTDIPYNVSGKAFPKIGTIEDGLKNEISYRFHGRGATFWERDIEMFFDVNASSKHQIIISEHGFYVFLKCCFEDYNEQFPLAALMEGFADRGIFIQRNPSDSFHVNENWYELRLNGMSSTGKEKFETDWN